jgi:hypothetical protein
MSATYRYYIVKEDTPDGLAVVGWARTEESAMQRARNGVGTIIVYASSRPMALRRAREARQ